MEKEIMLKIGDLAEQKATAFYMSEGYTIRERNWRPKGSSGSRLEIDIIAEKDACLVFCEVKARKPGTGDPVEAVTDEKIRRLCRAADIYLRMQDFDYAYRFDIVSIVGTCLEDFELEHIPDAFIPPLS